MATTLASGGLSFSHNLTILAVLLHVQFLGNDLGVALEQLPKLRPIYLQI